VADKYRRPCLDSSVFIGGIGDGEITKGIKRNVVFRHIWERAKAGDFPILISAIALVEVYKKKKGTVAGGEMLDEFLQHINEPFVQVIEVDREVGLRAHQFCRKYSADKLTPNDAVHLACAIRAGCDVLLAWDTPLVGIQHPSIRIEEPAVNDTWRKLFDESEIATDEEITAYDKKKAAETAALLAASQAAAVSKRQASADALADIIVTLHAEKKLPTPFCTKDVRDVLVGQFEISHLNTVLPNYCVGGDQVKRGRQARFRRVSKGNYLPI
jgi:predicted nucleic acid-binding protein